MKHLCLLSAILSATAIFADTRHYKPSSTAGWASPDSYEEGTVPSKAKSSDGSWNEVVIIPEGATVEIDNDDWDVVKICQIQLMSNSVLQVNKTVASGYFNFGYNQLKGYGTVKKTSSSLLLQTAYNGNFYGDWIIDEGPFGIIYDDNAGGSNKGGAVYIRSGAYIDCSAYSNYGSFPKFTLGQKTIHLAGDGTSTKQGAMESGGYAAYNLTTYHRIVLDDDASISAYNGGFGLVGTTDTPGLLDLNGHDLFIQGAIYASSYRDTGITLENMLVTNSVPASGGRIVLGGPNGSTHVMKIKDGVVFDENVTLTTESKGSIVVYTDAPAAATIAAKLQANNGGSPVSIEPLTASATAGSVNWVGEIEIASGKTLTVPDDLALVGKLTGQGTMKISNQATKILSGNNSAFMGTLLFDGTDSWVGYGLASYASVADHVMIKGSTVALPFPAWSFSEYLSFANLATYDESGYFMPSVTINPESLTDSTYEFNLAAGVLTNAKATLGIGGPGKVKVASLPSDEATRFAAWEGTLEFTCPTPFKLGALLATSYADSTPGKIVIDGAAAVDIAQNPIWIGAPDQISKQARGEMEVVDSLVYNHRSSSFVYAEGFMVGSFGEGKLTFDNSVVTSRVQVGFGPKGVGEFLVKGGQFCNWSGGNSSDTNRMLVAGYGGHGYIEFDNAQVEVTGYTTLGVYGSGSGVMVQKGGTFRHRIKANDTTATQFHIGRRSSAAGVRTVAQYRLTGGGKASTTHDTYVAAIGYGGTYDRHTYATFTVDGIGSYYSSAPFGVGEGALSTGIVNLNDGGTIYAKTFRGSSTSRNGKGYINFNGGIYDHRGWGNSYLFGKNLESEPEKTAEYDRAVHKVTVYEKGATIVTSSTHKGRRFGQPIHNATGKGVGSVPWTNTKQVFLGAPAVVIEGDGTGASAMAEYDSATGNITNILVTSAGTDYTTATAYLMQAEVTNAVIDLTFSLVDNDQHGSVEFHITTDGSFTFDVANDYLGETILSSDYAAARFNITNQDAFAKSSAIKLKSGVLYLGGYTLDELTAPLKFMGGTVAGESSAYVIPEGKMVIDLKDVVSGEQYSVKKNQNLTLPSSIPLLNAATAGLDESVEYSILTLPDNYAGAEPTFTGIPENWNVKRTATGFSLYRVPGLTILLK